ncbi:helix-turn-helix transcriptional regulator [Paraburkholderia susongensis]|uniref:HTH-type transcriptional regulator / antitoxin HipB n=1 Tax=Paraburkholderia susongensis TaxID=1515439 RepID=A0A1X7LJ93_9BURK|nr:helix-turn-helix transcriptional regulator [Paraburkholderia susongensis]SMG53855.1 HTH-type transcriptional regulator / antitoxin HipB [Paraburkholderia susongensis]
MDYPIRTLSQLRPILQGFRKAAGLTQAAMAGQLGVTQQTYAQLEANPAAVSVERLFKVLRILQVDLTLTQTGPAQSEAAEEVASPPSAERTLTRRVTRKTASPVTGSTKRTTQTLRKQEASPPKPARASNPAKKQSARTTTRREARGNLASAPARAAAKPASTGKKREDW